MGLLQLFGLKTFPHGIHPPEYKQETEAKPIRRLPFAPRMVLPLAQHIGKPSLPIVRRGQEVARGEVLAVADGAVSVPLHASVTGTVEDIALLPGAHGIKAPAIVLRTSPDSGQVPLAGTPRDFAAMPREELLDAVRDTGLVGLGGAGFPTHAKMRIPSGHKVHTLLVNGCECEPFMTADHRVMLEQIDQLLLGIRIALKCVGAAKCVVGIEDNKPDAIATLRARLPQDLDIAVAAVVSKYPQGAEKMLAKSLFGVEIPAGQFPSAVGLSVFNVATLAELGALLPNGQGLIERVVTVTGDDLARPGNYLVPVGTPLSFVLDCVGFNGAAAEVVLGGPMMGEAAVSLDAPVLKNTGSVLVLDQRAMRSADIQPCIRCGACLQACPVNLNPSQLGLLGAKREYETMQQHYHLNDCIECGCCSYVCPSNIPLVQYFRIAKAINREARLHA